MKKLFLALSIISTIGTSSADYILKYNIEINKGGFLPNNSIIFKESIKEQPPILDCSIYGISNECDERLNAWEVFAESNVPIISKNWNTLNWNSKSLNNLPSEPYPISNAEEILVAYNELNSLGGLSNLESVGHLSIAYNKLQNLNGLNNLKSVNYLSIIGNNLNNIDAISNLNVVISIAIDKNYNGKKLSASSSFCMNNVISVYSPNYAKKYQLCESQ